MGAEVSAPTAYCSENSDMTKILHINSVYGVGSTGRLTQCLHRSLRDDGFDSVVLYGRGPQAHDREVFRVCDDLYGRAQSFVSRFTGMPYGGCTLSTAATVRLIRRERPDIVHLQCVNEHFVNVYALVRWLRERQIRTVLTLHADFMFTANCGSALGCEGWRDGCRACHDVKRATKSLILNRTAKSYEKLRAAFNGFGNNLSVVSVSPWLTERASSSPMLGGFRHLTITNGVDVDVFHPIKPEDISQLCDIGNRKVVLHVTAQFDDVPGHLKGGSYVFELARRMKDDSVTFVVIGPSRTSSAIPKNVQMIGELSDINELARWYNVASCTLLTSKQETFSLVCAESLCCGTPVVGFQAGGPESVACPEGSSFVPFGDMDALEACVRDAVVGKRLQRAAVAERARSMYANDTMVKKYEEEYGRMLCR